MKYHVNKNNDVKPCNAKKRACRYGEHFATEQEGKDFVSANARQAGSDLPKTSRKIKSANGLQVFESLDAGNRERVFQKLRENFAGHCETPASRPSFLARDIEISAKWAENLAGDVSLALRRYTEESRDIHLHNLGLFTDDNFEKILEDQFGENFRESCGEDFVKDQVEQLYSKRERAAVDAKLIHDAIIDARKFVIEEYQKQGMKPRKLYRGFGSVFKGSSLQSFEEVRAKVFSDYKAGSIFKAESVVSASARKIIATTFANVPYEPRDPNSKEVIRCTMEVYSEPTLCLDYFSDYHDEVESVFPKDTEFVVAGIKETEDVHEDRTIRTLTVEIFEKETVEKAAREFKDS